MPEGKRALREAFKRLEEEVPERGARLLRRLRHPDARLIRIPIGLFCIVGGIFSFLPVLGIWMLPLGLLLIALDVPFLRKPVAYSTIWGMGKWASFRLWLARRWRSSGAAPTSDAKLSARESGSRSGPT
ncbi:MAG TPA: hypothetical protein VEY05_06100 [Beijerinckiaceae bacterium]|nr:hypothetical protein [Beijerinckiaceae bacterium]